MCVICYAPAGVPLPDVETRRRMWDRNRDGAGYMTIKDGRLEVRKGFMTFEHFEEFVANLDQSQPRVLHYRIGTNGANTPENTHPWPIDEHSALVHNGIISWLAGDKSVSDSKRLAELIRNYSLDSDTSKIVLEHAIGHNKVVILQTGWCSTLGNSVIILNEKLGEWHEGCWYSNSGYKEFKQTYSCDPRSYLPPPIPVRQPRFLDEPEQLTFLEDVPLQDDSVVTKITYAAKNDACSLTFSDGEIIVMGIDDLIEIYTELKFDDKLRPNIDQTVAQWVIASDRQRSKKKRA